VLVPLLYFNPASLLDVSGQFILIGVLVMIVGLAVVTRAGRLREQQPTARKAYAISTSSAPRVFWLGILMASIAGVLSAGLNFSFAFSGSVVTAAEQAGAASSASTYPVWALALTGGMLPNAAFSAWTMTQKNTWHRYPLGLHRDFLLAIVMGTLFVGSTVIYGWGASLLGSLGTSAGWGIMQTVQIVVGNAGGYFTGEWIEAPRKARLLLLTGLTLLILASALMALGNR